MTDLSATVVELYLTLNKETNTWAIVLQTDLTTEEEVREVADILLNLNEEDGIPELGPLDGGELN